MNLSRNDWIVLVVVALVAFGLYAQTMSFDFVYYDDPEYVFRNERVKRGLTADNVRWAFTTYTLSNWHPLTWLSYMVDAELFRAGSEPFGVRAGGFHFTNALLHAGNAALLFLLLRVMTGSTWRSALAAGLFAVHPLRVESVAWVSERKDVLSTLFGLLAMLAYARYGRNRSIAAYLIVFVSFALSLMAKPMLVTLPFVLLLLDYWPLRRFGAEKPSRIILEKVPLLGLTIASSVMTVIAQRSGGAVQDLTVVPPGARLANAIASYWRYVGDMVWPLNLVPLYPFTSIPGWREVLPGALALLLVTVAVVALAKAHPHLPVGWFWYLGTLVPVIGIVAVGEQSRADRYTYVPLIGLFILIAFSIPELRGVPRLATAGAAVLVLAVLAGLSVRQIRFWRNSETLFTRTLAVTGSQPSIHLNYGVYLADRDGPGDRAAAIEHYRASLRLRPKQAAALNNVAILLAREERFEDAIYYYRQALEMNPNEARTMFNLGIALLQLERYAEAEPLLRQAVRLRPDFKHAQEAHSYALEKLGNK